MQAMEIQEHARRMWETSGPKAIALAAQRAQALEQSGDSEQAQTWRRIEAALKLMGGPRES